MIMAVYSNSSSAPSARLGVTSPTPVNSSGGWQTISLQSPVTVNSGQTVWLSWIFENAVGVRHTTGLPARAQSTASWSGGMPATFGTASFANYRYSVYCTYTTSPADEAEYLNEPVEMNTVTEQEEVLIYPNPTEGEFTVSWKNRYDHRLLITIYNITGQIVKEVQTDPDMNEIKFNLKGTSEGIYLLEIQDRKNDLILNRSRIIKK